MNKTGKAYNILGFPVVIITIIKAQHRISYKIKLFRTFMIAVGYSEYDGDNVHIQLGITKLELFTSFTIKKRWLL